MASNVFLFGNQIKKLYREVTIGSLEYGMLILKNVSLDIKEVKMELVTQEYQKMKTHWLLLILKKFIFGVRKDTL